MNDILFQAGVDLSTTTCAACGIIFALPSRRLRELRESGDTFFCPSGHNLTFGDGQIKKLEKELAKKQAENDQLSATVRDEKKKREDVEAAAKRTKDRVSKGVCPCCRRHFCNLQAHMKNQHPDYTKGK